MHWAALERHHRVYIMNKRPPSCLSQERTLEGIFCVCVCVCKLPQILMESVCEEWACRQPNIFMQKSQAFKQMFGFANIDNKIKGSKGIGYTES